MYLATTILTALIGAAESLKTLVAINLPLESDERSFKGQMDHLLYRNDVNFLQNPANVSELVNMLNPLKGEFDRFVFQGHGNKGEIPIIGFFGNKSFLPYTELLKILNDGKDETLREIHLSSCYIGDNFDKVAKQEVDGKYYKELSKSLRDNQVLYLHGDNYVGSIGKSFGDRLEGIISNKNYGIFEAVVDSSEALSVAVKKNGALNTYTPRTFGRDNNTAYTIPNLVDHLDIVLLDARTFESENDIRHADPVIKSVHDVEEKKLTEYLGDRFAEDLEKFGHEKDINLLKSLIGRRGSISLDFQTDNGASVLIKVAYRGYDKAVHLLIENGANVDLQDNHGNSALMWAAAKGYDNVVKILDNKGANKDLVNVRGNTALISSVENNHTKIAQFLGKISQIDHQNNNGEAALAIAARLGYQDIVVSLMNDGADVNLKNMVHSTMREKKEHNYVIIDTASAFPNNRITTGDSPLITAVRNNHVDVAEFLAKIAKVNQADNVGNSGLLVAATIGNQDMARLLLANGADASMVNKYGESSLIMSIERKHFGFAKLLIENIKVSNPNILNFQDNSGNSALIYAARKGYGKIVKALVEAGADVDLVNNNGDSALIEAANEGHEEIVEYLGDKVSDKHRKNNQGQSALTRSVKGGHAKVIKLLDGGELKNSQENDSLFIDALMSGNKKTVELMLNEGVNLDQKINGNPILINMIILFMQANKDDAYDSYIDIAKLLIARGANVNVQSDYGWSPLMSAVHADRIDLVEAIINVDGVDLHLKKRDDETALDIAKRSLNQDMIDLIQRKINEPDKKHFASAQESQNVRLDKAIRRYNYDEIESLLDDGADPNLVMEESGEAALNEVLINILKHGESVIKDSVDIAKLLIAKGANVNVQDNYGWSPLMLAVRVGKIDLVETIINVGDIDFSLKKSDGETALDLAKQNQNQDIADLISEAKSKKDEKLFLAARNKDYESVRSLLESGYDPNITNKEGFSLLAEVIYANDLELTKILLHSKKIDPYAPIGKSKRGNLNFAVELGRKEIVELFLEVGADPNRKDDKGWTPLNSAIDFSQNEIAKILLDHKDTDKNLAINNWTPLMMATAKNNKEIVKELLERGADLNLKNPSGKTALEIAKDQKYQDLADLITTEITARYEAEQCKTTNIMSSSSSVEKLKIRSEIQKDL